MSSTKLKNAPLKEVIFELFWERAIDAAGVLLDEGFDLAQGKFADRLKAEFPLHRKLIPDGVPFEVFGAPIHQYWHGEFKWPVVQHGQGMIAVNEVEEGYEWANSYKPTVTKTIERLIDSYEKPLIFTRAKLQYIDAWEVPEQDPVKFMEENLQTQVITRYDFPGSLSGFNVHLNFQIQHDSVMSLNIANGINNENQYPSVIWTTQVERNGQMTKEDVLEWIDFAHNETSIMFKKMLKPEFYASLDQ